MKTLIIAEEPSVAADLSRALGKFKRQGEHFENDEYVISSAVGHLVELAMPEEYDKKYSFWRLAALPIIPQKFKLKPIERSKKKYQEIKKLLARKDIDTVINACDAGREGELIFSYTYKLSKAKQPVKRLWMLSMTQSAIQKAFANLRDGKEMANLADAARCRSEADWLIGINCTRGATKRLYGSRAGNVAGVGRVQTPTLAIVQERENQIRNFKSRDFWRITASFQIDQGTYEGVYQKPNFKKGDDNQNRIDRIWDQATAQEIRVVLDQNKEALVTEEKKKSTQAPSRLYDLTTLQREANNRFGFSARRTLQLAQALYEKHKMLTYPRTDSKALPEDYIPMCKETLANLEGSLGGHAQTVLDNDWVKPTKRIFNNAKISDHFAIIPTPQAPKKLSEEEYKIFDMIARRFIAVFCPPAEFNITTRHSQVAEHIFKTEGKVLTFPGWLSVYGKDEADENGETLPALSPADGNPAKAALSEFEVIDEKTKPPARYTEATLLSAMEGAGKLVEDEELADAMKEKGLGTPATRAQVIERLIGEKYMERDRRDLVPTAKAETLLQFLCAVKAEELTSPALTGEWEHKLHQIEDGFLSGDAFMKEIIGVTKKIIKNIQDFSESDEDARVTDWNSPTDTKPMLETLRTYRSQDGKVALYKVIGNRRMDETEIRELLEKRQLGPLSDFRSKAGRPFTAKLKLDEEFKVKFEFEGNGNGNGEPVDYAQLESFGKCPRTGGDMYETPSAYVVRLMKGKEEHFPTRLSRKILAKELSKEHFIKLLEDGKTDLIQGFISNRTKKPFAAFLVLRANGSTGFQFPPREKKPKADKKTASKKSKKTTEEPKAEESPTTS
ncbi:MAG: DNA topoisomerase III [Opitutaceae bacterium]|nr:DNA topoisomerase III [Opitutaceae bacterium]